jgi:hypothetical protein
MKKIGVAVLGVMFVFCSGNAAADMSWLDRYNNSNAREMCMQQSFDQKIDAVILEEIPSILDTCGIGGMFDFCSKLGIFGSVFGEFLGCGSGGRGGRRRSNFCDWGFDARSAKEAWRVYRKNVFAMQVTPSNTLDDKYSDQYALNDAKLKALGITL